MASVQMTPSGKENQHTTDRLRRSPYVKDHIQYYNDRTKKASQIPRPIKPLTDKTWSPPRQSGTDTPESEGTPTDPQGPPRFSVYSEVPTASSVYSESPEFPHEFQQSISVAPLFAGRSKGADSESETSQNLEQSPPTSSTARKPLPTGFVKTQADRAERMNRAGLGGLGLDTTSTSRPWQGNTGIANLMTPIADQSVASGDAHSISPLSSQGARDSLYSRYGRAKSSGSPGPTISDIDDREEQYTEWDQIGNSPVPMAIRSQTQVFSHDDSASTLRPIAHTHATTPERTPERTPPASKSGSLLSPQHTFGDQDPTSRFSWTTKATEDPRQTTPTRPSFETSATRSPPQTKSSKKQPAAISRFSWTTRDTRAPEVPQHAPPSPETPPAMQTPPGQFSIMARSRPLPSASSGPPRDSVIKRKPTPSVLSSAAQSDSTNSNKDLPLSPPELDSIDIITALRAQLDDCANRRRNMEKLIATHTALQPQNPLTHDLAKRRADREKIAMFERDLADVRSREHELGLRLHRAWKRRDQEAPTTLWVRRICS